MHSVTYTGKINLTTFIKDSVIYYRYDTHFFKFLGVGVGHVSGVPQKLGFLFKISVNFPEEQKIWGPFFRYLGVFFPRAGVFLPGVSFSTFFPFSTFALFSVRPFFRGGFFRRPFFRGGFFRGSFF